MEKIAPAYADSPFTFRFPEFDKTSSTLIDLDRVSIGYDKPIVSANITLLHDSRYALLGPNGAGKTTTFDMIVGLISPEKGEVFLNDLKITKVLLKAFRGYLLLKKSKMKLSKS